jgi:hypothetical protein|tara:strand:- start:137 stop:340 length:204 start_codon:yes stop_codon:yes gene_type:complete
MNEYRIKFWDNFFAHEARVFIFAENDFEAQQKVMDTYDIPKHWITHVSLWRQNVNVKIDGENIMEVA